MTWEPITASELQTRIDRGISAMSADERLLWRHIRCEPTKWSCPTWGEVGRGFWVVATLGQSVIWFNDIEDGFNLSAFTNAGVIDEYWCNQDELQWVVRRLTEATARDAAASEHQTLEGRHSLLDAHQLADVWSCLHDGHVTGISEGPGTSFTISCQYITQTLGRAGDQLVIEVSGPVSWKPWDDDAKVSLIVELVSHEPEILTAEATDARVVVHLLLLRNSGGALSMSGDRATLRWEDGAPLPYADLTAAVSQYWRTWRQTHDR